MLNNISAQTALNKTFSTGSVWQGNAVGLGYGGTGSALTAVAGAVLYSTSSGLALTAAGTSGQILVSGGSGSPTFVAASSIAAGTSTLATTATNIAGGSAGQLIIQADTSLSTFITAGASGTFLRSAGAGYAPTWATADVTIGSTVIALGSSSTSLAGLNIIAATGTSHWTLPVGTTGNRPVTPAAGMVRYNSTITSFEGYSSGAWSSLGGVSSVDKFTYIQAETAANASNGDLDFFAEDAAGTAATQVGQWNRTNLKDYTGTLVGTQTTQNVFNSTATTVNAFGAATNLTIGGTTGTQTIRPPTVTLSNATTLNINGASPTIASTSTGTLTLFNTALTTVNAFGAATTISIGAATGTLTINNANTVITGNLTVNGTTTTINSTVTSIDDIEFELGSVASPTDITAAGGGIRLKGATDKTINWSSIGWTSSEDFNLVTGKSFEINGTNVLDASSVLGAATSATVAGVATTLTIGATTGTATIRNATVAVTNILTVGSTSTFTGATTHNGGLSGTTGSFSSTLGVTGTSTFTGLITANGGLSGATSGTHTGAVVGNASTATTLQTARTLALTGDATASSTFDGSANYSAAVTLAASGVSAGTYTFATITVNAKGLVTSASSNTVSGTSANTANTLVQRDGSGNFSAGTITASGFQVSSDERLKSNITKSSYGLKEILSLNSVQYDKDGKHEIGLIAQQVEPVMPEFVSNGEDGYKSLNYSTMVSVLIKAVQELSAEVESLKKQLG
jgi:hypothetical protein